MHLLLYRKFRAKYDTVNNQIKLNFVNNFNYIPDDQPNVCSYANDIFLALYDTANEQVVTVTAKKQNHVSFSNPCN